jgi:hypothetical protein
VEFGRFLKVNKMQYKIINTGDYLLIVDDSEIKEGDYVLSRLNEIVIFGKNYLATLYKKIIANLPLNNSSILEGVPLLPPLEDDNIHFGDLRNVDVDSFMSGYNKAKETYKYTEFDIIKAFEYGWNQRHYGRMDEDDLQRIQKIFIQSLQQPKIPVGFKCEVQILRERPTDIRNHVYDKTYEVPKTTTNSQGLTQWVGEYIYE